LGVYLRRRNWAQLHLSRKCC